MRVISGDRRGFKLKSPKGNLIRPTEDQLKERVFNIISPIKFNSKVLDCFSGTGGIGIEFLSRGAGFAYFVDLSKESTSLIHENVKHTKFENNSEILNKDISSVIRYLKKNYIKIDYFYLDPPYLDFQLLNNTIHDLDNPNILNEDSMIIVECDKKFEGNAKHENIYISDRRDYKNKSLIFYKVGTEDESNLSR